MNIQKLKISKIWMASILLLLSTAPGIASAQVLAEVEGPIDNIVVKTATTTITVMGIDITVPNELFANGLVHTPTAQLLLPSDLLGAALPGRSVAGFLGGTAIITGVSTPGAPVFNSSIGATSLGTGFVAADVFVEPAENVVLGSVTAVVEPGTNGALCDIYVEGTHAVFSTDTRMPASAAINGFGFEVDECGVTLGGAAAVEGYYGTDGKLHIFAFESDDAPIIMSAAGITTISRASCDRGKVEIRGSSTLANGTATVSDADNLTVLGEAPLIADLVTGTSIYRFREDVGSCPNNVRVETTDGFGGITSPAIAPVDI